MLNIVTWLREIHSYRELLISLASKQIKVKYKHPVLGFLWALLVPLCLSLVFMIVFSKIIKVPASDLPFFIFLITAMFPWNFFSLSVTSATMSILEGGDLIKKAYFPREVIPMSIVLANLVNFSFTVIAVLVFLVIFQIKINFLIFFLPIIVVLQTFLTTGVVFLVSGLQVRYRDVKFIVEVLLMLWFYLTPIFYPLSLVANISGKFLSLYMLNPLTELITLYRIVLLPNYADQLPTGVSILHLSLGCAVLCFGIFYIGLIVFRKFSPHFADYI